MSHPSEVTHAHAGGQHESDHAAAQVDHGSMRSYLTGFVLAAILTLLAFWLVMARPLESNALTIVTVLGLAAVQIVVHMIFFLHLNTRSEQGWNMLAFIFTIVLVVIVLGASIWVMYNENANMMPMSPQYQHNTQDL